MAARVCASCWLALPKTHMSCDVCGRPTHAEPGMIEPEDVEWKTRVDELKELEESERNVWSEEEVMRQNRTRRMLELGLPFSQAAELAIERGWSKAAPFEVDVHEFENLVAAGCPPETAARILR